MTESEAIQSVMGVIISVSGNFCVRYPNLDRSEVFGESQIIAVNAMRTHDPKRERKLSSWVQRQLWRRLTSLYKIESWRFRMSRKNGHDLETWRWSLGEEHFDLRSLLLEVSEDAKATIVKALELDSGVKESWLVPKLTRTLREEFGWEWEQIIKVFKEIREAL